MVKFILSATLVIISCGGISNEYLPGFDPRLFKGTECEQLANAVINEDTGRIHNILSTGLVHGDFQESKFGLSVFFLAVGNQKTKSVEALLKENIDTRQTMKSGKNALDVICQYGTDDEKMIRILSFLVERGFDVNKPYVKMKGSDTIYMSYPIFEAKRRLKVAKFLYEHGADMYVVNSVRDLLVWWPVFNRPNDDESLLFLEYLIVEKNLHVPDPIGHMSDTGKPLLFLDMLKKEDVSFDPEKEKAKERILAHLTGKPS